MVSASLTTGANTLNFQAANIGFTQALPNTLTIPVTIVFGVVSVNNPDVPYQIGQNQETDAQLRIRRQKSTSMPSQGYLQALIGGLYTVEGLAQAVIYENTTNTVDANGVPGHSIWAIVDGGSDDDVANMIYTYRNAGCGMVGGESVNITQVDGSTFTVYFDRAIYQDLYVEFNLVSISATPIDPTSVINGLINNWIFGIYEPADTTTLSAQVKAINPDYLITNEYVSGNGISYSDLVYPSLKKSKFVLRKGTIKINGSSSSSSWSSSSSCSSSSSSRSSSSSSRSSSSSCSSSSSKSSSSSSSSS